MIYCHLVNFDLEYLIFISVYKTMQEVKIYKVMCDEVCEYQFRPSHQVTCNCVQGEGELKEVPGQGLV